MNEYRQIVQQVEMLERRAKLFLSERNFFQKKYERAMKANKAKQKKINILIGINCALIILALLGFLVIILGKIL